MMNSTRKQIDKLIEEAREDGAPTDRRLLAELYLMQSDTNALMRLLLEVLKKD